MNDVEMAFVIGIFPTICMTGAVWALSKIEVSPQVEAATQNFAAGLILAAVAGELFPILLGSSAGDAAMGTTFGFIIGLAVIFGVEHLIEYVENLPNSELPVAEKLFFGSANSSIKSYQSITQPSGVDPEDHSDGDDESLLDAPLEAASAALTVASHRQHIHEHITEVLRTIEDMDRVASQLSDASLSVRQKELLAERVDEQVHSMQYKIDHVRRLLQGSESAVPADEYESWVTEARQQDIRKGIQSLRHMAEHMAEHLVAPLSIDKDVLRELHMHMRFMDRHLSTFHHHIEHVGSRWHRARELMPTLLGDTLPLGLVVPVFMDAFVDGFLMGISSSISLKAGIVLSFANCLEMGFLGMAYSARLVRCTGSPVSHRVLAMYSPAVVMFLSAGLGGLFGSAVEHIPSLFIGLVAFGTVALLFLVCNELLIEAKTAMGEQEKWWVSSMVFLGIYVVLMLDHIL